MNSTAKTAFISLAWLTTIAAAYLLGSKGGNPSGETAQTAHSLTGDPSSLSALGAGNEGDRADGRSPGTASSGGRSTAADRILRLLDGAVGADLKRSEFDDLAANLSLEEVRELIDAVSEMDPGPAQRDAYQEIIARWAELDPTAALDHVAGIEEPRFQRDATMNVLRHWAAVDPAAALAFAEGDEGGELPEGSLSYIFRGIGNSPDTGAALSFLATLGGSGHEKHMRSAIAELFERNDAGVIEWASSLPAGDVRDRSIEAMLGQWARYDPAAARAWLEKNTDGDDRSDALAALGESWARSDPEKAAAWASELAETDPGNGKILGGVMKRWMESDLASAAGYMVEQDPNPAFDSALERYINRIKNVDADATLAWAESISDPGRRRNAVRNVIKVLRSQDPDAYASYVASSPELTDAERAKLLGLDKTKEKKDKSKKRG